MCSTVLLLVLAVLHSPREWSMAPVLTGIPVYVLAVLHSPREWSMAPVLTGTPAVYVLGDVCTTWLRNNAGILIIARL